ncbi:3-deoxy-D-manno-octulosonic acid transferase [Paracoccus sp. (in: a-proteobacteria)]|uniref:3-deoxy-D-manno-octulosonic acid transferase n=1 Tax=Paracoccus sp. TaxID=267 RepID=UPI0026E0A155|nr:glycosyltransferase N-terminal domain-containing protein [Paracoccus sp. (in: a-proteobacteria)]MDO5648049.1 glycosyltransferase N-terminal domain-containing protein [Paracoccus sp. (in: a-proteobacteria)]
MIYNAATHIAGAALRMRAALGGDTLRARLMLDGVPGPAAVWVHGASVGELTSARPIIDALARRFTVQVTTNSTTGRDMVAGWGLPVCLAPLDVPGALRRFLDAVQPRLSLTIEAELWPRRSAELARRGVAQAVIGARMSERSARKWARLPGLIGPLLARIDAASAQDAGSQARLMALGLRGDALLLPLDLKLLTPAQITPPDDPPDRARVILAASTHPGEDAPILDAFATLTGARLILAPRHPQRGDDIAALIAARNLRFARRSQGADDAPDGGVLLADTLGEMPRWYARAQVCFVGGSLVDHGGHTPWEPAAYRCAILRGPYDANFADSYAALHRAGAARVVTDDLARVLADLTANPDHARAMGQAARKVLTSRAGEPGALTDHLSALAMRDN